MSNKRGINTKNKVKDSSKPTIPAQDIEILHSVKNILLKIKKKPELSLEDIKDLFDEELSFPVSIFTKKLTVLESIVKFLKEEKKFSYSKIAGVLSRDQKNIWHIYHCAFKKYLKKLEVKDDLIVPFSIFTKTKLSAQEAVVAYLKDEFSMNFSKIALILHRDNRTVWTVYNRARGKNETR